MRRLPRIPADYDPWTIAGSTDPPPIDTSGHLSLMKNNDLQIGVIGSGGRGGLLARLSHKPGKGARIVACCDINPGTLARNRTEFGADIFTTHQVEELLAQTLDAVIIGTPDFMH